MSERRFSIADWFLSNGGGVAVIEHAPIDARSIRPAVRARSKGAPQYVQFRTHIGENGVRLYQAAAGGGQVRIEGIVAKRADSPYRRGRTSDWVKKITTPTGKEIDCRAREVERAKASPPLTGSSGTSSIMSMMSRNSEGAVHCALHATPPPSLRTRQTAERALRSHRLGAIAAL